MLQAMDVAMENFNHGKIPIPFPGGAKVIFRGELGASIGKGAILWQGSREN